MIASLVHDDAPPRALETFDAWAARGLYDALGPVRGASQIVDMAGINAWGILPDVAEQSGIGTGECTFLPEHGHGGFSMKIDRSGDWVMIRDTLSALESATPGLPADTVETIVGRPVTDVLDHPWLDKTMIVERVVRKSTDKGLVLGLILTNTAHPIDEIVGRMERGERP